MLPIDRKFVIRAKAIKSGKRYDENSAALFLAKDKAFLLALPHYLEACKTVGAGPEQLKAVELMIERVKKFQADNPQEVKIPDVDPVVEASCLTA